VHLAGVALDACNAAIERARPYLIETDSRPEIDELLQKIDAAAARLLEMVEAGGESTLSSSNARGWDFAPWLHEKSSLIREGIEDSRRYFQMDPTTVSLTEEAPMTPKQWINDRILFGLDTAQKGAHAIFSMVFNDEIEIKGQ
jgi:hypothetical protein